MMSMAHRGLHVQQQGMGTHVAAVRHWEIAMSRKQILVVDDEWDIAELLIYLLAREGYGVEHAQNGEIAFKMLTERPWDLVLTDLMMPVLDGSDLLRRIRARPGLAAIPVMMLSSLPEYLVREKCERVDAVLRKPFQVGELLGLVSQLVATPLVTRCGPQD
jgi:two-component system, OmpR family, response regulator VicR